MRVILEVASVLCSHPVCVCAYMRTWPARQIYMKRKEENLQNPNKLSTANSMNEENITKKQTNIIQQLSGAMVLIQKSIDNQFRTSLLSKTCYKKRKSKKTLSTQIKQNYKSRLERVQTENPIVIKKNNNVESGKLNVKARRKNTHTR